MEDSRPRQTTMIIHHSAVFSAFLQMIPHCSIGIEAAMVLEPSVTLKTVPAMPMVIFLSKRGAIDEADVFCPHHVQRMTKRDVDWEWSIYIFMISCYDI